MQHPWGKQEMHTQLCYVTSNKTPYKAVKLTWKDKSSWKYLWVEHSGLRNGLKAGFCEHGDETLYSIKA